MADVSDKKSWPQTPDGTTDWEVVFENPDTGFLALVAQSQSVEALRMTATVVIETLFTRRGDEEVVVRLKDALERILAIGGEADIAMKRTGVTTLLRKIKTERIEKARVYVER
ncbi:MAG: hypothetical protein HQL35_14910, partial [Alphaproteobacteria bacterium]|nr:hypothetical protein [Alphaproteobacteria bacterium]